MDDKDFLLDSRDVKSTMCKMCTQKGVVLNRICIKHKIKYNQIREWLKSGKKGGDITHDNIRKILKEEGVNLKVTLIIDEEYVPDKELLKTTPFQKLPDYECTDRDLVLPLQVKEGSYNRILEGIQDEAYVKNSPHWWKDMKLKKKKYIDFFTRTDMVDSIRYLIRNISVDDVNEDWHDSKEKMVVIQFYNYAE